MIGRFFLSDVCVFLFEGWLLQIIIMIDGSEKYFVKAAFELQSLRVFEKRSKKVKKHHQWSPSSFYGGPPEVRKLPITEFLCETK